LSPIRGRLKVRKGEETYAGSRRSGGGFGVLMGQSGCVFCRQGGSTHRTLPLSRACVGRTDTILHVGLSCIRAPSPTSTHLVYSIHCHRLRNTNRDAHSSLLLIITLGISLAMSPLCARVRVTASKTHTPIACRVPSPF
jgi:hypothetical protein